jgi:hypothetical protein
LFICTVDIACTCRQFKSIVVLLHWSHNLPRVLNKRIKKFLLVFSIYSKTQWRNHLELVSGGTAKRDSASSPQTTAAQMYLFINLQFRVMDSEAWLKEKLLST